MFQNNLVTLLYYPNTTDHSLTIHNWLKDNPATRFNYIVDDEAYKKNFTVPQLREIYPEIKVISTAVNPWTNVYKIYVYLLKNRSVKVSINEFALTLEQTSLAKKNICEYLDTEKENVDFILRSEFIEQDFKKVSEHFKSNHIPITFSKFNYNHRTMFNKEASLAIEKLFKADIEYFGY